MPSFLRQTLKTSAFDQGVMIIQSLKSLEIDTWYWGNSMQSILYKLDFHADKVCELLWSKLIIQNQSDEWMNDPICSVEAIEQAPIMLVLRLPSRVIVSVVKTYLLICSISFLNRSKNSPTSIRQNFAENIYQNIK